MTALIFVFVRTMRFKSKIRSWASRSSARTLTSRSMAFWINEAHPGKFFVCAQARAFRPPRSVANSVSSVVGNVNNRSTSLCLPTAAAFIKSVKTGLWASRVVAINAPRRRRGRVASVKREG